MKSLIAVMNSRNRREWADVIRSSWLSMVPTEKADVRFFVGRGDTPVPDDTVQLDVDDTYKGLPEKVRGMARWACLNNYDYMLKCDDDVVLNPKPLLDSGYDSNDFTGRLNRFPTDDRPYTVPMGFNYWLSKRCMELVSTADLPEGSNDDEKWVSGVLYSSGITLADDKRYRLSYGVPFAPSRSLRGPIRPLKPNYIETVPGEFSWCVFLDGNNGQSIPLEAKLEEFKRLFRRVV